MSQQINLFDGIPVRARDWFSLPLVAVVYLLAAGVMLGLYGRLQDELAVLKVQQTQAQAGYEAMQKKLEVLASQIKPVDNTQLNAQLQQLQARLDMQTQVLQIFSASLSAAAPQLIDYMRALAAQPYPGVWLTGFSITPALQHLSLMGKALQTQDIPAYLGRLSLQKVFAGTQFSGIQFKQIALVKPTPAAGGSASPASAEAVNAAAASPASESSAAVTNAKGSAGSTALPATPAASPAANPAGNTATTAAAAAPSLTVYAFEVKGQDMQAAERQASGLSWDAFVEQTIQAAPAK